MGRSKGNRPNKSGRNDGPRDPFTRLPHAVQASGAYAALTPNARALLMEILSMHNGENNGSLWLSVIDAAHRMGIASKDSARAAFAELIDVGFLRMTKEAHWSIKASETSRARCWRITFLHAPGTGLTDEWRKFEPTAKAARTRMERGLRVRNAYYKAKAQEKLPVLDSGTIKAAAQRIEALAVPDSGPAKPQNDEKQPKFVRPDSGPYIAMTMGMGRGTLCWREGGRLSALPDILIPQRAISATTDRMAA
ncbi:MAG: hypothetical protein A2885_13325 [Sphingopyxis sp. RIFCSPHIGHO2_01_FULL_65_24]|nr:MAG: hypothetical protein A2885_13325 [Sphingopyxis sp. RIFCSPHIGHO2_01_FULL_65_24]